MARAQESKQSSLHQVDGQAFPIRGNGHIPRSALTPRQREIAGLLARGLPNADIADQLVLSTGTVANHIAGILQRLGLESRTQVAAWAVEQGLHGGQDRLLGTLERLLHFQPATLKEAVDLAANLIADALDAEKADLFLHDEAANTLLAVGTSTTDLGRKQHAARLDCQPLAFGGRAACVFLTGEAFLDGAVHEDDDELMAVKNVLNVRSQIVVPFEVDDVRRGVLVAQSTQPSFFSERDLLFLAAVARWISGIAQRAELAQRTAAAAVRDRRQPVDGPGMDLAYDLRGHLAPARRRLDALQQRAVREQHAANLHDAAELRSCIERIDCLIAEVLEAEHQPNA